MPSIQLTPRDAEQLEEILESYLADLRSEIIHTESAEFRKRLKAREALLLRLVGELAGERAAT